MSTLEAEPSLKLQVGGTLNPRRHVYIERSEDAELLRLLLVGEYVNVLTSRQMGKSSLMVKTMLALRARNVRTASIDLAADLTGAEDVETWFRGLISRLSRELRLDVDITGWWGSFPNDTVGQRLQRFMREVVGAQITGPKVIFLDEIDNTLKHDFTDAFFTAIRGMYNERGQEVTYENITFCLLGVAAPNELIKDRHTTAYNVGQTLELRDFDPTHDDLQLLAEQLHRDARTAGAMLSRVLYWTGGHPYIAVSLCAALRISEAESPEAVDAYVEQTFATLNRVSSQPHFQQILIFIEKRLSHGLESLQTYGRILNGERIREQTTPAHLELKLSGLIKRDNEGCLVVRNRIYQRLFDAKWLATTRPKRRLSHYRNLAIVAGIMLVLLAPVTIYYGYGYFQRGVLTNALGRLGDAGILVSGNPDTGFTLTLPDNLTRQDLEDALAGFPRPEAIRAIVYSRRQFTLSQNFTGRPLDDVSMLRSLNALQVLDLSVTQVSDIAPLAGLTALQTLNLFGTKVSDVAPLAGLTALRSLNLSVTQVSDVAPLKGLTALRTLDLSGTKVRNVAPLADLTALQSLSLTGTKVSDIAPLAGLTALQSLSLAGTKVSDVAPLKGLTVLQSLSLSGTPLAGGAK